MKKSQSLQAVGAGMILAAAMSWPAVAQVRDQAASPSAQVGSGLEEIVVQARRRSERLIDVPASITALDAAAMTNAGIESIRDVGQYSPGLIVADGVDDSTNRFFIRGIGTVTPTIGAEPSVPIYIDDIYTPSGVASNINVFGFDRVEVLRGPQGTLYGRNSYGGAIKFYTKQFSDTTDGYVTAGVGNNHGREVKAEFATPVIPGKLWFGGGAASNTRDGYQTDPFNGNIKGWGQNQQLVKAKLQFDPVDVLRMTVAYDDTRSDAPSKQPKITNIGNYVINGGLVAGYPGVVPNLGQSSSNPDVIDTDTAGNEKVFAHGLTWSATLHASEHLSLKYLGSSRTLENIRIFDIDGTASSFLTVNEDFNFSGRTHELQANWSSDRLNVVGGVFRYQEDTYAWNSGPNDFLSFLDPTGLAKPVVDSQGRATAVDIRSVTQTLTQQVTSTAAFVNGSYGITERLNVSAGVRWTKDDKATQGNRPSTVFVGGSLAQLHTNSCFCVPAGATILNTTFGAQLSGDRSFDAVTPELSLDYKPSRNQTFYGSYKRGFQAGTIYPSANVVPGAALSTDAQTVDAFEVGSKGIYFDGALDLNVAVYYNRFNNLVVSVNTPVPISVSATGFAGVPQNAGAADSKGIEFESRFNVSNAFILTANIAFSDLEVTEVLTNVNGVRTNVADSFLKPYSLAPTVQGNIGAEYNFPVGLGNNLRVFVNAAYRSKMGINSANGAETSGIGLVAKNPQSDSFFVSDSMTNLSAGASLATADRKWRVDFTGHNLLDERRPVAAIGVVPNFLGAIVQWNEPRNWRVGITRSF